jgi:hypothetical protein
LDLSDQLQKKSYRELDARDRQWIALVYYDGWKALSASAKSTLDEPAVAPATPTPNMPGTNQDKT